jgi:hypothetical protein
MAKMTKYEKRGDRTLSDPPKVKAYKRPVTVYTHYMSQGGELLAFAWTTSRNMASSITYSNQDRGQTRWKTATKWVDDPKWCDGVAKYLYALTVHPDARLITLPSQFVAEDVQLELAA